MQVRFGTELENIVQKYTGISDPTDHVEQCRNIWSSTPKGGMDTHVYTYTGYNSEELVFGMEMHRETTSWDELVQRFKVTFTFEHESPLIDASVTGHLNQDLLRRRVDGGGTSVQCTQSFYDCP
jgi:hypothetical protein